MKMKASKLVMVTAMVVSVVGTWTVSPAFAAPTQLATESASTVVGSLSQNAALTQVITRNADLARAAAAMLNAQKFTGSAAEANALAKALQTSNSAQAQQLINAIYGASRLLNEKGTSEASIAEISKMPMTQFVSYAQKASGAGINLSSGNSSSFALKQMALLKLIVQKGKQAGISTADTKAAMDGVNSPIAPQYIGQDAVKCLTDFSDNTAITAVNSLFAGAKGANTVKGAFANGLNIAHAKAYPELSLDQAQAKIMNGAASAPGEGCNIVNAQ